MEYKIRKLTSKDIFPMVKLISKFGIGEFKKCFDPALVQSIIDSNGEVKKDQITEFVGMSITFDIAGIIMSNIWKCEDEIYAFLESMSGLERQKLEDLSPAEFAQLIIDILQQEEFSDFFSVVSKLLK